MTTALFTYPHYNGQFATINHQNTPKTKSVKAALKKAMTKVGVKHVVWITKKDDKK